MTTVEVSNRIDTALNKYQAGISVDEYVKSLYATKAQSQFVDRALTTYEYGDHLRHILGKLLKEKALVSNDIIFSGDNLYKLPLETDVKQIVYEVTNTSMKTIPLDYNDIHDTLENPFRTPDSSIAYRVTGDNQITLYTSESMLNYSYIYCKVPKPIILESLPDSLELQGLSTAMTSELPYDSIISIIEIAASEIFNDKAKFAPKQKEQAKT